VDSLEGIHVLHTSDLPDANRTSDGVVMRLADDEGRVLVTKDADFVSSHLMRRTPRRLLLVSLGNTTNARLMTVLSREWDSILAALEETPFVELSTVGLVLHDERRGS
jgi:predicted nuclease of predicted toxin-antitoxin system